MQGQFNSAYRYDSSISVSQALPFPMAFGANRSLAQSAVKERHYNVCATESDLIYQVKSTYYSLLYHHAVQDLLLKEDSIYRSFMELQNKSYEKGKGTMLEKTTAETKVMEINSELLDNTEELVSFEVQLQTCMNRDMDLKIRNEGSELRPLLL